VIDPAPAIGKRFAWEPSNELGPGDSVSQELKLPPGTWDLSLQYQSPVVGLTIEASGQEFELPAAMDGAIPFRLGEGPFWPVGRIEVAQGPVEITVRADDLSAIQSLLGVNRRAAIGNIVATAPDPYRVIPFTDACGAYVDHFEVADSVALRDPGAITHRRKIARAALQGRYDPRNLPDE
jgi:hypothetical protein